MNSERVTVNSMELIYAQALWKMVEKGMDARKAVSALREILTRHGREALLPRIGAAFARVAAREGAKRAMVISVAREKDIPAAKREMRETLRRVGADSDDVMVRVDDVLIGGWRLEGRGHLYDASHKKYLLDVYNHATQ